MQLCLGFEHDGCSYFVVLFWARMAHMKQVNQISYLVVLPWSRMVQLK